MFTVLKKMWSLICDLHISYQDVEIAGVCGGLGETVKIPSWIFRLAFIVAFFFASTVISLAVYFLMWVLLPHHKTNDPTENERLSVEALEKRGYEIHKPASKI